MEKEYIKIGKKNCVAYCKECKKANIFYSILNGSYIYYCLVCKQWKLKNNIVAKKSYL